MPPPLRAEDLANPSAKHAAGLRTEPGQLTAAATFTPLRPGKKKLPRGVTGELERRTTAAGVIGCRVLSDQKSNVVVTKNVRGSRMRYWAGAPFAWKSVVVRPPLSVRDWTFSWIFARTLLPNIGRRVE